MGLSFSVKEAELSALSRMPWAHDQVKFAAQIVVVAARESSRHTVSRCWLRALWMRFSGQQGVRGQVAATGRE